MGALATEPHPTELHYEPRPGHSAQRLFEPTGSTFEDLILGVWEDLMAGNRAECPVCGERLRVAGGCESCGSELS